MRLEISRYETNWHFMKWFRSVANLNVNICLSDSKVGQCLDSTCSDWWFECRFFTVLIRNSDDIHKMNFAFDFNCVIWSESPALWFNWIEWYLDFIFIIFTNKQKNSRKIDLPRMTLWHSKNLIWNDSAALFHSMKTSLFNGDQ